MFTYVYGFSVYTFVDFSFTLLHFFVYILWIYVYTILNDICGSESTIPDLLKSMRKVFPEKKVVTQCEDQELHTHLSVRE